MTGSMSLGELPPPAGAPEPAPGRVLRLRGDRSEGLLAVPDVPAGPVPLLVFLHGSGGRPQQSLALVQEAAGRRGVAVLAPRSAQHTWDVVLGEPGPDVAGVRELLALARVHVDVDPAALALGGFSDGGSGALSLGLANPHLVAAVLAFSPGFFVDGTSATPPRCFLAHGTGDRVLPIARTTRRIVPLLRARGGQVEHVEFDGGHEVPADLVERALAWWLDGA